MAAAELSPVIPFCILQTRTRALNGCSMALSLPCAPAASSKVHPVPGGVVNLPTGQEE